MYVTAQNVVSNVDGQCSTDRKWTRLYEENLNVIQLYSSHQECYYIRYEYMRNQYIKNVI